MAVQVAIRVAVQVAIRVAVQVANQGGGLGWRWPTCTQRDVRIVLRSVEECGSLRVVHQIRERSFGHVLVEHGAALGRAWRGGRRRGDVVAVADRGVLTIVLGLEGKPDGAHVLEGAAKVEHATRGGGM